MANAAELIRKQIVGTEMSAITFVRDYVQMHFDGPKFNVMTPMAVSAPGVASVSGDDQFRNRLCGQIGKMVAEVSIEEGKSLQIAFADGSRISMSLKEVDFVGPEGVNYFGNEGLSLVI